MVSSRKAKLGHFQRPTQMDKKCPFKLVWTKKGLPSIPAKPPQSDRSVRGDALPAQFWARNASWQTKHGQRSRPRCSPSGPLSSDRGRFAFLACQGRMFLHTGMEKFAYVHNLKVDCLVNFWSKGNNELMLKVFDDTSWHKHNHVDSGDDNINEQKPIVHVFGCYFSVTKVNISL
jgi:hypothetical protein